MKEIDRDEEDIEEYIVQEIDREELYVHTLFFALWSYCGRSYTPRHLT